MTEFFTVNNLMAFNTESQSIVDIEREFWILRERFYMVRVQFNAALVTFAAGVIVAFVNAFAPFLQLAAHLAAPCLCRLAALPVSRISANSQDTAAPPRAEPSTLVFAGKFFSARLTMARLWGISNRPASLRAVFSSAIRFVLELLSANGANVDRPVSSVLAPDCVVTCAVACFLLFVERVKLFAAYGAGVDLFKWCTHTAYYSTLSPFCVAVILERMATAFPGIEIERIDNGTP